MRCKSAFFIAVVQRVSYYLMYSDFKAQMERQQQGNKTTFLCKAGSIIYDLS